MQTSTPVQVGQVLPVRITTLLAVGSTTSTRPVPHERFPYIYAYIEKNVNDVEKSPPATKLAWPHTAIIWHVRYYGGP